MRWCESGRETDKTKSRKDKGIKSGNEKISDLKEFK